MKKNNTAWLICAAGMLAMLCNMGLSSNILAVYLPFIEETGISGAQGSAIVSVRCISSFVSMFLVAEFYKKISLRRGIALSALIGCAGYLVFAAGGSIFVYYVGAVLFGISYGFGTMIPVSILITRWFEQDKGTALGICSAGTGAATIIFSPIITANTQANGLRSTYFIMAGFVFLCAVILYIIIRDRPEDIGKLPYGEKAAAAADEKETESENFNVPIVTWFAMLFMLFLAGGAGQAASAHVSIAVKTAGYTATQAGLAVSIYGIALILGKLLMGRVADVIGAKNSSLLFMIVFCAGCLIPLLFNGTSGIIYVMFALILGLGCPFFTVGVTLWASDLAPKRDYEKTIRYFQILYAAGGIVFTAIPGRIADITHEYISTYLMLLIMILICMFLLIIFYRKRKTLYK